MIEHCVAGATGDRMLCAVRREAFRRVALDLCADRELSIYLNVFVLVSRCFQKVPALHWLRPTCAVRTDIRVVAEHHAVILHHRDHRRGATI